MKVSVIGAGKIGSLTAYNIALRGFVDEVLLIDISKDAAEGQALDIGHSLAFKSNTKVSFGNFKDMKGSGIVIISAGKPRTADMSRLDLAKVNAEIVKGLAKEIKLYAPNAIIITITNPMDVMNYVVCKAGFKRETVIGFGGMLDSARLRFFLAKELGKKVTDIEAWVLGEHGDSQVPIFSRVKVNGKPATIKNKDEIREMLRKSAAEVIAKKKATEFAPTTFVADIVEAIVKDKRSVMPCSAVLQGEYGLKNISIGVPVVLGKNGIEKIEEWKLTDEERKMFMDGAKKLKEFCSQL